MTPLTQASDQPPARYLNGKLVAAIATDYGGYTVTLAVSQLPSSAAVALSVSCRRRSAPS